VALVAVALFEQTWFGELLEDQTVNLRFRARAPFDPPADPRLVFVGSTSFPWLILEGGPGRALSRPILSRALLPRESASIR